MYSKSRPNDIVRAALFLYTFKRKEMKATNSYDNDEMLLIKEIADIELSEENKEE